MNMGCLASKLVSGSAYSAEPIAKQPVFAAGRKVALGPHDEPIAEGDWHTSLFSAASVESPLAQGSGRLSRQGDHLLINTQTSLREHEKLAFVNFHNSQHKGLFQLHTPNSLLADVGLHAVLGEGGFACVFKGQWRGSTDVAVKIFATQGMAGTSPGPEDHANQYLPARALAEAVLARDLAHPNVIRAFDVRSCQLDKDFLDGVTNLKSLHAATKLQEAYQGTTPLWAFTGWPQRSATSNLDAESIDMDWAIQDSGDGFGSLTGPHSSALISWHEILLRTRAKEGDLITVIIMQLANYGSLWEAIRRGVFASNGQAAADVRRRLRALLRTAREIAMGLEHLHAFGVVHGDLKPGNVLLQDSRSDMRGFTAMVSDFGLSHVGNTQLSVARGTASHAAPELLAEGSISPANDIYAFGILLSEMVTGMPAYPPSITQAQIIRRTLEGQRPDIGSAPGIMSPELKSLYLRCVHQVPSERPTASEVVRVLSRLEERAHRQGVRQRSCNMKLTTGGDNEEADMNRLAAHDVELDSPPESAHDKKAIAEAQAEAEERLARHSPDSVAQGCYFDLSPGPSTRTSPAGANSSARLSPA